MAIGSTERFKKRFRNDPGTVAYEAWGDDTLLDEYLEGIEPGSSAAFAELVRRHGPMVLGVCRHVLGQAQDAEDAFQAAFLVLARNAGSIRERRVLARWLYEVSYRIAIRARARTVRRRSLEKEAAAMTVVEQSPGVDPAWTELRPVLHEEVNRLPEKYRSAVVLCYLEGRTNEEAASLLDWPVGTVKGRLSRARDLLRTRLSRRGLALSAAFLSVCLSKNAVFAEVVPSRLVEEATETAAAVTRGGVASASTRGEVVDLARDPHDLLPPASTTPRLTALALIGATLALLALFRSTGPADGAASVSPPPIAKFKPSIGPDPGADGSESCHASR